MKPYPAPNIIHRSYNGATIEPAMRVESSYAGGSVQEVPFFNTAILSIARI
jgi:hypothetical protein